MDTGGWADGYGGGEGGKEEKSIEYVSDLTSVSRSEASVGKKGGENYISTIATLPGGLILRHFRGEDGGVRKREK